MNLHILYSYIEKKSSVFLERERKSERVFFLLCSSSHLNFNHMKYISSGEPGKRVLFIKTMVQFSFEASRKRKDSGKRQISRLYCRFYVFAIYICTLISNRVESIIKKRRIISSLLYYLHMNFMVKWRAFEKWLFNHWNVK